MSACALVGSISVRQMKCPPMQVSALRKLNDKLINTLSPENKKNTILNILVRNEENNHPHLVFIVMVMPHNLKKSIMAIFVLENL